MERPRGRVSGILIISVLLLFAAGLLLVAAKNVQGFARWYSVCIYPLITGSTGRLAGCVHISVAEAAALILPVFIIADAVRCRKKLREFLSHMLLIISVLIFLYAANCGVNYYRDPFVDQKALSEAEFSEDQLVEFCEYIILQLEACSEDAGYPQGKELAAQARRSMYELSEDYPSLQGYYPAPKQLTVSSGIFSGMGVSGIYSPFTVEANINGEMPDLEKPFTACHELSHLRGYMNEGEANYIGWLACIGSESPAFRRSGWLIAWLYAGGSLRRADPDMYERLYAELPEYAVRELEENRLFWSSHEGKASELQDRVNDTYLKANGQKDGIRGYGMLTTLMLLHYQSSSLTHLSFSL